MLHLGEVLSSVITNVLRNLDELRLPASLALRVTLDFIYPAAPAQGRVDSLAPAHFGLSACRSMSLNSHCLHSLTCASFLFRLFVRLVDLALC
jgi:hypothetical protein